jgi:predicted N-acetyltransferase YhbS
VLVREVEPEECERAGQIVVAAYRALPGHVEEPDYERELADVASRADSVFVAVDDDGAVVGCITFVPGIDSAHAEFDDPAAAGFRMLGVDPERQGSGAGRALVAWCVDAARAGGRERIVIHSTPWMTRAHAMYSRFGFERRPELDCVPVPDIELWGFVLELGATPDPDPGR